MFNLKLSFLLKLLGAICPPIALLLVASTVFTHSMQKQYDEVSNSMAIFDLALHCSQLNTNLTAEKTNGLWVIIYPENRTDDMLETAKENYGMDTENTDATIQHVRDTWATIDKNAQCSATCGFRRIAETSIISSGITSPPPAYVLHNTACQALQPTPNCRWQYPVSVSVVTTSLPSRRPACLHIS